MFELYQYDRDFLGMSEPYESCIPSKKANTIIKVLNI